MKKTQEIQMENDKYQITKNTKCGQCQTNRKTTTHIQN